jgi:hypothetical protein
MHSQTDQIIAVAHLEQLRAAAPWAQVWVTPTGEHAEFHNPFPAEYEERVNRFFTTSLK